jgi:hypothetical protein
MGREHASALHRRTECGGYYFFVPQIALLNHGIIANSGEDNNSSIHKYLWANALLLYLLVAHALQDIALEGRCRPT